MNRIVIFSGTTEGRMLAQTLSENGIHCIVFVATEYGESVMPEMDGVTVHKGRMDLEKMQKFIAQSEVAAVVDATHPFATAVSENIRESLKNTEIPYIRLQRETSDIALNKDTIQENHSDVILCSDATECADFLNFHRWKHPAHNREQRPCHIQSEGSIKRPPVCPCIAGIGEHISLRAERHLWKTDYCDAGTFFIGNEPCTDQTVSYKVPGHKGEWQNRGISGKNKSSRGGRNHCLCDRQSGKTKQWGFFCTGVQKNFQKSQEKQ